MPAPCNEVGAKLESGVGGVVAHRVNAYPPISATVVLQLVVVHLRSPLVGKFDRPLAIGASR